MPILAAAPTLLGGLALAGAGAGLSIAANNASQAAIDAARRKSAEAEAALQNRARGVFDNALPNNTANAADAAIAKGQSDRQGAVSALENLQAQQSPVKSPLSAPAQAATARASTAGNAWSNAVTNAQAKLGGYNDFATSLGVQNADTNNQLGVINNEARGTAALLPLQIEAASHKGDPLSFWGKIVGSLGTAAGGA